ncbi:MAG: UDP-2,3-diacylglucosamine diphosphatase [Bacteroidota bacterium]
MSEALKTMTGKIYFISDFHFGVPDHKRSLERERRFVEFLNKIEPDAKAIYLMGDLFDFWFEYKTVIPKGFTRLFGKLAEFCDKGIAVHLFRGNHDIWAFDYLQKEIGIILHREHEIIDLGNKKFFLAHGDGYGPGDYGYKFIKKVFELRFNQWLFRWLHPDWGTRMALYFSRRSRIANMAKEDKIDNGNPPREERLFLFAQQYYQQHPEIDFFIMGHRHRPLDIPIEGNSRCVILGDWIHFYTYAVFDGENLELEYFGG